MPESNFPSSLDTDANSSLPKTISDTAALNSPNHAEMHGRSNDAIIEIQTKMGTGSSGTPTGTTQAAATGAVLIGTGSGASAWDTTPTFVGDVTIPEGDLILGSTAVTSTAAELNILDGCTATVSELNIIDGVTATTAEINYLDNDDLTAADLTKLAAVTSTAAELNLLDGSTAGTVVASKAVVVDADKDIASFRNVTLTGELDAATLDLSSSADIAGDLVLSGGADGALQFTNAGENSIKIPDNQASALIIEEADNAYITFVTTNGSEAITVAKTTNFTGDIDVDGTTDLDAVDIDGQLTLADGSSGAPAMAFGADTDVGIYREDDDTLAFAGKLFMSTALPQTSTGSYATLRRFSDGSIKELTSSERFKKDITDVALSDAYKILDARPIHYRDINDDSSDPVQAGLSAESLHDSGWTYAVTYDEDTTTPKGINYEMLVAPLITILKDINNRLETLEG